MLEYPVYEDISLHIGYRTLKKTAIECYWFRPYKDVQSSLEVEDQSCPPPLT